MSPLPYRDTGAAIAFYALLVGFVALEQRTRLLSWRNHEGARVDRGSFFVVVAAIGGGIAGAFVLASDVPSTSVGSARWPLLVVGLVLMATGIGLRQWAVAVLGRFFTVDVRVQDAQTVVDSGPYRIVRHPSYTGMLVTFAGIGLALGNWLSLACVVVAPLIGLVVRIRVEEAALLDGLGEPYRRYAAGRARLVPHIW